MKKNKINRLLHKWLSIPLGLIIFVVCLTGALLVFQQETLELSNPSHYFVEEVKGNPILLNELVPMINEKLEGNSVANVKISNDPTRTYTMGLAEGFRISVFVNQYTGEVMGRYDTREHGFFVVMSLHRWLLDSTHTWGKYIVGWATVLFVVIVITGLFYLGWRSKEKYKMHFNKGPRAAMFGLHNTLGLYGSLLLIVCALSGLMWSFDWFRNSVFALAGAEQIEEQAPRGGGGRGAQGDKKPELNTTTWQVALENTMKADANYDYIRIGDGVAAVHPNSTYRTRVLDQYKFDKKNGEITEVTPFAEQDVRTRVWAWAYSLHVGDYWGVWSKMLTFFFCLVGASLPITGYYFTIKSWISKRKRLKKSQMATK